MPGKIIHGRMPAEFIGGPFAVFYLQPDGKIGASVTGIQTAAACDDDAREYSRAYGAPIASPMLVPSPPFVDVDRETAYGTTMRLSRAVRVF